MAEQTRDARGRWPRLGERLGLVPVVRRRRVCSLVGERDGYLVAVSPSHSLNTSSVDVLVRFPRSSTVRGLREDILDDPALGRGFGRAKGVPRSRRKDLVIGDGVAIMRLTYSFFP